MGKKRHIYTEEEVTNSIIKVLEENNLKKMPGMRTLVMGGVSRNAFMRFGGFEYFSKKLNIPYEIKYACVKTCETCGKQYKAISKSQKYCSDDCRTAVFKICAQCGKEYSNRESTTKYCSEKCKKASIAEKRRNGTRESFRPSEAFNKVRIRGLPYRLIQLEENPVERIDISKYEGLKTFAERMADNGTS